MDRTKRIIIVSVGLVILLAAFVTVMKFSTLGPQRAGFSGAGLPMRNNLDTVPMSSGMPYGKSLSQESLGLGSDSVSVNDAAIDKKIIKNGELNLKVSNADLAFEKISQVAKDNGGEVTSSNFYQSANNLKSGNMIVKVPVANFEKTFDELKNVASLVLQESISGQDVTEEYIDLQAQLKNKQAEEQSFLSILDRAGKIEDVLAVTREIARVRGEIESLQGRIKFLESQTDMASISMYMTEDANITISDSWRPWQLAKETFNSLFKDIRGLINFVIVLIIRIIPVLILYAVLLLIAYWIGRKIYLRIRDKK